jgi:hypothetical protein
VSIPLKDFRGSFEESSDMWLEVRAQAQGIDKQTLVRNIVRDWAKREAHAYKIATKRLQANGLQPELFGEDAEDAGGSRSGGRK